MSVLIVNTVYMQLYITENVCQFLFFCHIYNFIRIYAGL